MKLLEDMRMANAFGNPKSEAMKNIAEQTKAFSDAEDALAAEREANLDAWGKQLEEITQKILNLENAGMFENLDQKMAYEAALIAEAKKERLDAEFDILKAISAENKKRIERETKQREHQNSLLAKKEAVEKAKASGDKNAIKAARKDLRSEQLKQSGSVKDGLQSGLKDMFKELTDEIESGNAVEKAAQENLKNTMKGVGKAITEGLNAINNSITSYAQHQTAVNARLQGASSYAEVARGLNFIATSPLLKSEDLYNNVAMLVEQGIVTNLEQRAMFATVKDGIATTFDVSNDSLKRIIRLQQNDSTAARLGMEAYLTEFLNIYVENTEYLTTTFDTVASSLLEASAILKYNTGDIGQSLEFEYQVQKWLSTLGGLGLSDEAANNIAAAIGQLGSGDVEGLSSGGINNLLLMGANKAGNISYATALDSGLTADMVNSLMYGVVSYMQELNESGSNVVRSQLAKTFGLSVSDLIAASNLSEKDLKALSGESLTYQGMYDELGDQFDSLVSRVGIGNMLDNLFTNLNYQTGANIARNPALFALWKVTDMIQNVTGGINVPFISAMGNGFDLNTTVENLMKLGIVGTATLGNIGGIIGGLATVGKGSLMLSALGVNADGAVIKEVGSGLDSRKDGQRSSGSDTSSAAYVGNQDGQSYADSAVNEANDDAQRQLDQKLEEFSDPMIEYFDDKVQLIPKLESIITLLGGDSKTSSITPSGDSSGLSDNQTAVGISTYLGTDEFTSDFKSIVLNVAKLVESPTVEQTWSGSDGSQISSGAGASIGSIPTSGSITGLTQSSSNRFVNPLKI